MKKSDLHSSRSRPPAEKICVTCGRPFTWRKKWEKCWDEVKHCSEKCRRNRKRSGEDSADL